MFTQYLLVGGTCSVLVQKWWAEGSKCKVVHGVTLLFWILTQCLPPGLVAVPLRCLLPRSLCWIERCPLRRNEARTASKTARVQNQLQINHEDDGFNQAGWTDFSKFINCYRVVEQWQQKRIWGCRCARTYLEEQDAGPAVLQTSGTLRERDQVRLPPSSQLIFSRPRCIRSWFFSVL